MLTNIKNIAFGTSGVRGLVVGMTDEVCYVYTTAFLKYLEQTNQWQCGQSVVIGGDLRSSTPRIMAACARACVDMGAAVVYAGFVPSPAVALYGLSHGMPSLMVTGSHIPDDRNGIKFNTPDGEILKSDEQGITDQIMQLSMNEALFDDSGMLIEPFAMPTVFGDVRGQYIERYVKFFGDALRGLRVGVYQHSTVGRDVLVEVLTALGAQVTALGRSDAFISVDTEAIRPEDVALGLQWAADGSFDAIVSADGDADRPLVSDEHGVWLRGDVLGVLCAKFLGCSDVVTPVSSNTLLEKSGWFESTVRTRIGSPYVIEGMQSLLEQGKALVAGYEANGGFLLASDVIYNGRVLRALPTRDAVIVMVSILAMARDADVKISRLAKNLPQRFTVSDRIKDFPTQLSIDKLTALRLGSIDEQKQKLTVMFDAISGEVLGIDETDGLRMTFVNDEIIHLRPSGNAPELRCYTEAATPERALEINQLSMKILNAWRNE